MVLEEAEQHLVFLVERAPEASADQIVAATTRLDALVREHRHALPPALLHYLQGRSYHKALAMLRGMGGDR